MIRGITMIALGGAALSLTCFGIASSRAPLGFPFSMFDGTGDAISSPAETRVLPWPGGHMLSINLPARVIYQQALQSSITVTGSERLVRAVALNGDSLDMQGNKPHDIGWRNDRMTVTVTAPELNTLKLNGFGSLYLRDYHQSTLTLAINGATSVKGNGQADNVTLSVAGAGSVDLSAMEMKDLNVSVTGAGSVRAGPTGHAVISIDGAGSVKLTRVPESLSKEVGGIGSISVPHDAISAQVSSPRPVPSPTDQEQGEKIAM